MPRLTAVVILITLAVVATIQSSVDARLALHTGSTEMSFEFHTGIRS